MSMESQTTTSLGVAWPPTGPATPTSCSFVDIRFLISGRCSLNFRNIYSVPVLADLCRSVTEAQTTCRNCRPLQARHLHLSGDACNRLPASPFLLDQDQKNELADVGRLHPFLLPSLTAKRPTKIIQVTNNKLL